MNTPAAPALAPAEQALVDGYLRHVRVEKRLAERTVALYTEDLLKLAKETAAGLGIEVKSGVYCAISGPGYCTRAELRMLRQWGADAIGMSTVPEAMAAAHMSMKVLGVSCVTDMAIADELEPIRHEIVMEMANKTKPKFIKLIKGIIGAMKG